MGTYRLPTVIKRDVTGEVELVIERDANSYQISILSTGKSGTFKFEAVPYIDGSIDTEYEKVFSTSSAEEEQVIDLSKSERTFSILGFFLDKLKVIPELVTEPFTVIVQQEDR